MTLTLFSRSLVLLNVQNVVPARYLLNQMMDDQMCQSKLLKSENDNFQKRVVDLKSENRTLKPKVSGCDEKEKENQQQIKTLKSRLAKESGENLIVAEENNKLVFCFEVTLLVVTCCGKLDSISGVDLLF